MACDQCERLCLCYTDCSIQAPSLVDAATHIQGAASRLSSQILLKARAKINHSDSAGQSSVGEVQRQAEAWSPHLAHRGPQGTAEKRKHARMDILGISIQNPVPQTWQIPRRGMGDLGACIWPARGSTGSGAPSKHVNCHGLNTFF